LAYCAPLARPKDLVERLLCLRPSARPNRVLLSHIDDFLMWKGALLKAVDANEQIQTNRRNYALSKNAGSPALQPA
jgi:predicted protein tyrosine phosphatase